MSSLRTLTCAVMLAAVPAVIHAQGTGGPKRDPMQELLPLRPTRTLAFTTTTGNWMSSDVSHDGQTIVFDLLGDIYTMPMSGGKATALTRGMGFDAQPRFSPDGKKIVYVSDRTGGYNLWTISLDRKDTVQITTGNTNTYESPVWTPDGKYLVATRGNKLWLFPASGGSGMQLIRDSTTAGRVGGTPDVRREEGPAFGNDPRYIYFAQRRGRWVYNTPLGDYDLMQYDRETGRVTTKENRWGSAFRPTLSPDGKWLVYGTRYVDQTRLRLRNLVTNEDAWLTGAVQRDDQESLATLDVYPGMSFTPDSKYLVTTWGGKLWKVDVATKRATEIPFQADVKQALGPHVAFEYRIPDSSTFTVKQIRDATPSPDGRRLAFVAMDHLYVMDYPSGTPRRLTNVNQGEFEPVWSPDGMWIAYTTWDDSIGYLNRMRSDGSGRPQRLTPQEGMWTNPVYTPNGTRIVATRAPSRSFRTSAGGRGGAPGDLVWIPAAGGASTFIASNAGDAHFSARDTSRIFAYTALRGLYSMRWDGTDIKSILRVIGPVPPGAPPGGRGAGANWLQLSPDGAHALAQVNLELYYIPDVPWPGGPEPTITVGGTGGTGGAGGDAPAAAAGSAFPTRRLTDIGAQFPHWGQDGSTIHWSIGNAHVVYDVARATAFDDSVRKALLAARNATTGALVADSAADPSGARGGRGGNRPPPPLFKPSETRIRLSATRDIPQGTAVLRGARIITMNGTQVIERGDIVITNNRITALGVSGTVPIPRGATEIDVTGKTISPGFVDTHAHLRLASGVHRDPVWSYAANLAYGVTTARDPQTGTTDVLSYEDQEKAGLVLAPRIYSTGPGVFAAENIRSLDNARTVLKRYAEYYDTKTIKEYMTGNREVRQWVIQAANELRLMPTTEGGLDYKMNMTEAIDGYSGHEHTIPTYPLQSDVIRLLSESGITYTPTIIVAYGAPWAENYWYEHMDLLHDAKLQLFTPWSDLEGKILRRGGSAGAVTTMAQAGWFHDTQYPMRVVGTDIKHLIDAGGSAGIGSHGQQQGIGYHWELWNVGMGDGMTSMDALRIATILGANALGLGKDVGSLEVGKLADLVVFDRNPLSDLRNSIGIRYVMKNGRLYDALNLDEVYPRQVKGAPFPWNEDESPTRDATQGPGVSH
ncbi:MAG: amidohydrolase family protein [bacterium]